MTAAKVTPWEDRQELELVLSAAVGLLRCLEAAARDDLAPADIEAAAHGIGRLVRTAENMNRRLLGRGQP